MKLALAFLCAGGPVLRQSQVKSLNISKKEQRTLHALARGGAIIAEKDERGKIIAVNCVSPEGWSLADCTLSIFRRLKRRGLIASSGGRPYQITYAGRIAVRPQLDNRA